MNNTTFISDQFETWQTCQKKYYFKYVKRLRLPENKNNFRLGKSVHALVQYYLKGHNIEHLERSIDEDIQSHWNAIKNSSILTKPLVCVEWGFNALVKGTTQWLNGRIDAVFYDEELKRYIIVDWKTGQNIPKNPEDSFQCKMYLYSFYKAQKDLGLKFDYSDLCFQYIKTPDLEFIPALEYSAKKEAQYSEEFKHIINLIETTKNYELTTNSKDCKYCPYSVFCNKS